MPSLRTAACRGEGITHGVRADAHGSSLHAGVRCGAQQRKEPERLCRSITRTAIACEPTRSVIATQVSALTASTVGA